MSLLQLPALLLLNSRNLKALGYWATLVLAFWADYSRLPYIFKSGRDSNKNRDIQRCFFILGDQLLLSRSLVV